MDISELASRLGSGRIFHAYIVTGGNDAARERAGQLIARAAVCRAGRGAPCGVCRDCVKAQRGVHPDIEVVRREKTEYTVDTMRALRARAMMVPNEAERAVYIVTDADAMNIQAQNAMLKIFEEPPEHGVFVLLAANPLRLLPTVRSRCETVNLPPEDGETSECRESAEEIMRAYRAGDGLRLVEALGPVEKLGREKLPELLGELRALAVRDRGLGAGELARIADTLDEAERIAAVNVSAGHISGLLLARLCVRE